MCIRDSGYLAWWILRSETLEGPARWSFDPSAEGAMRTARPPLSLIICPCLSLLSTDYCLSPCCHTLRRCSLIVRTLCLRREKWDHYPPAVTTRKSYWRLTAVDFIYRVSLFSPEMSYEQDQLEHFDAPAVTRRTRNEWGQHGASIYIRSRHAHPFHPAPSRLYRQP